MKAIPHWVTYTALRLLMIIVPLVVLMLLGLPWWLATIIAAVIGLCLSYLLLAGPRHGLARDLADARTRTKPRAAAKAHFHEDDDVEDRIVDAASESASGSEREGGTKRDAVDKPDDSGQLQH